MKLQMFWTATYQDGSSVSQFDFESGAENLWASVDQNQLKKIAWIPFDRESASKVKDAEVNPRLNILSTLVPPGTKPVIFRRQALNYSNPKAESWVQGYFLGLEGNPILTCIRSNGEVELVNES